MVTTGIKTQNNIRLFHILHGKKLKFPNSEKMTNRCKQVATNRLST